MLKQIVMRLVLPRCRQRLTHEDESFLSDTLAVSTGAREALVMLLKDSQMRDVLLDEKAVLHALLESTRPLSVSPDLYFYVLVRHSLRSGGIDDRDLADYLASLLIAYLPERGSGRTHVPYIGDRMSDISAATGPDRFFMVVELADQLLFLTGVFPAHVEHRRQRRGAPSLDFYEHVGLAQYRTASSHALAREFCLEPIFNALGEAFHEVRVGLNRLGETLAFTGDDGPMPSGPLLN
ncbi:MAG: hypothetical protein ACQKBW_12375 [Puniceicoccales bacterium]